jgi:hypothetical protein
LLSRAAAIDPERWSRDFSLDDVRREEFLRFVVDLGSGRVGGLFRNSELIEDDVSISRPLQTQFRRAIAWFDHNLPAPQKLPQNAVCWFRADSTQCLKRLEQLIEVFRASRHAVWMQSSTRPGAIVYEDKLQIAAIPYRDRRPTSRRVD